MITIGIDEVGRGCWAGPLVAGAVMLSEPIVGLKDSKQLTSQKRRTLDLEIREKALSYGLGWVDSEEVDDLGLTQSTALAMNRALEELFKKAERGTDAEIIVDGNINYLSEYRRAQCMVGGDRLVPAVSAASIIAKVARDTFMIQVVHAKYPMYSFDKHVGYGTAAHLSMLQAYGVCPVHRRSFRPVQRFLWATGNQS